MLLTDLKWLQTASEMKCEPFVLTSHNFFLSEFSHYPVSPTLPYWCPPSQWAVCLIGTDVLLGAQPRMPSLSYLQPACQSPTSCPQPLSQASCAYLVECECQQTFSEHRRQDESPNYVAVPSSCPVSPQRKDRAFLGYVGCPHPSRTLWEVPKCPLGEDPRALHRFHPPPQRHWS